MRRASLVCALAFSCGAGCAKKYAYTFHVTDPGVHASSKAGEPDMIEDADVKAEILVDATTQAILLNVTNKTDQVLQVGWGDISLTRGAATPTATSTTLRPDMDLGWLQPGANVVARLFPMALPRSGDAAAAYEGLRFELSVPMVVRREAKTYHYALAAHVREL
jgi:hypothetical protein